MASVHFGQTQPAGLNLSKRWWIWEDLGSKMDKGVVTCMTVASRGGGVYRLVHI